MSTLDTKEVELLFPQGKAVILKGETVTIKPFGFGKYPKVLTVLKKIKQGEPLLGSDGKQEIKLVDNIPVPQITPYSSMGVVINNMDLIVELIALSINKPLAYFDDLSPDEGITAGIALMEVNIDFFVKRLQPRMVGALTELTGLVGDKSLQDSLQQVTA